MGGMSDNPLKVHILSILKDSSGGLSEHELIRRLEADKAPFPDAGGDADLVLFQKHFMVMNGLYQLQDSLFEEGLYLAISPLSIHLEAAGSGDNSLPTDGPDAKLREYYLDWSQLAETTASDVDHLLTSFWEHYLAIDKRADALTTLGLEGNEEWVAVQQAYRRLAAQHHPDRGGEQAKFMAVREAYEILSRCMFKG